MSDEKPDTPKPQNDEPKMGRPRLPVSKEIFEGLCMQQATLDDVAAIFQCSRDTVERRVKEWYEGRTFADISRELRKAGIVSLRQAGFKMAKSNPIIHKFYMTNYGGMRDTKELKQQVTLENFRPGDEKRLTTEQLRRIRNGESLEDVLADRRN